VEVLSALFRGLFMAKLRQALKVLKRKMQREGVFREMKRRKAYEKPSERQDARESRSHPARAEGRPETGSARRSNPDA
jgi:ribosomal protein S21